MSSRSASGAILWLAVVFEVFESYEYPKQLEVDFQCSFEHLKFKFKSLRLLIVKLGNHLLVAPVILRQYQSTDKDPNLIHNNFNNLVFVNLANIQNGNR